jgi:exonuclease SbcC
MITYDYLIERKTGEGKLRRFVPTQIPTKLNNVVLIEGKNSSGKSTLLNIIAMGLFGTKNRKINPVLQSKMNSLLNSNHQKIKFSFKITSENDTIVLESEKTDLEENDFVLKESLDGITFKPISFENFEKKYNLIYDIPNNPTERLPELLKELKEEQLQFGDKLKFFNYYLDKTSTQITSSRDPKRLEEVQTRLIGVQEQKDKIDKDLPNLDVFLDLLEKRAYIHYYCYYSNEGERLTREKKDLKNIIEKSDTEGKKQTSKISRDKAKILQLQTNFSDGYNQVTQLLEDTLPKSDRSRFKIWKSIQPYSPENNDLYTARLEAAYFSSKFSTEAEKMRKDSAFNDASTWEKVFQSLKEFEDSGLLIPQFKVTIGEFVNLLKEESKKSSMLIQRYRMLNQIIDLFIELRTDIDELQEARKQLQTESVSDEQLSEGFVDDLYQKKHQLRQMETDLVRIATKCNEYYQRCLSKNIDEKNLEICSYRELIKDIPMNEQLEQYLSLGEKHVTDKILELQREITEKRGKLSGLDMLIGQYERDIINLKKQKPHKFESYLEQINKLLIKTNAMSQRLLVDYNTNLKDLIDKKVKESDISNDSNKVKYYSEVSSYLAHRIGTFRHIDRAYKAKIVDLISGIIIADDNEIIHLSDMGTGQTQSAYILSLLNVDIKNDPRKIIALFDEIAMMDDDSLEPISSKMKELKKQNQLLVGILVQKGNETNVRVLG